MAACDQPFDEVEKPEFIAAMSYGRNGKFTLPKRDGVRRRIIKLGDETVEQIQAMFEVRFFDHDVLFPYVLSYRLWREKSAFLSTPGHRATATHFWPSWLTISRMRGSVVSVLVIIYPTMAHVSARGVTHRLPGVNRTAFRGKYGSCSLVDVGDLQYSGQGLFNLHPFVSIDLYAVR